MGYFTIGSIARVISQRHQASIHAWQVRRVIQNGLLAEPPRFGAYRMFAESDIPRVETALIEAGYLAAVEVANA